MKTELNLDDLSRDELINILAQITEKLKSFGTSGLKQGQRIIIGSKYASHPSFCFCDDEYKDLIGQTAVVLDPDLGYYDDDENGNRVDCITVNLENDTRKRKKKYTIHPEDAITID